MGRAAHRPRNAFTRGVAVCSNRCRMCDALMGFAFESLDQKSDCSAHGTIARVETQEAPGRTEHGGPLNAHALAEEAPGLRDVAVEEDSAAPSPSSSLIAKDRVLWRIKSSTPSRRLSFGRGVAALRDRACLMTGGSSTTNPARRFSSPCFASTWMLSTPFLKRSSWRRSVRRTACCPAAQRRRRR
jgi:hypothetical protein